MGGDGVRPRGLRAREVLALDDGRASEKKRPAELGARG
jgi:hypothetical protein